VWRPSCGRPFHDFDDLEANAECDSVADRIEDGDEDDDEDDNEDDNEDGDDEGKPPPARYPARNVTATTNSTAAHDQGCADDLRPRDACATPGSIAPCLPGGP